MSRGEFMKDALAGGAGAVVPQMGIRVEAGEGATQLITHTGPTALSLSEASHLVREKRLSPLELTQACFARIEALNPSLNAFITVTAEAALAAARSAEAQITRGGWKGPLHGIPVAIKDLLDTAGIRTTAGSALFKDRVPTQDAEVVRRLRAAGAVLLGKLNMHEFAFGGSSAISYFGAVRNPWNLAYSPGGSSGGSAAAVAAGLCYAALGSDTGGSIREPAAYCGIVGLKPTYGRVSTSGAIPLAWSLDHIGPMTRTVADAASVLQIIAGYDSRDPGSVDLPVAGYLEDSTAATSELRLGILRDYFYESLDPDIEAAMQNALSILRGLTRSQREVAPLAADATYASVMNPYVSILSAEAYEFHKDYIAKSPELYQAPTLKRLRAGADVTKSTYIQCRRQLDQIRHAVVRRFDDVDVLVTPTTPVPPFTFTELSDPNAVRQMELQMLHNTRPINMLGLPSISVPCGLTGAGLPIGLQICGRPGAETSVLALARAYERAVAWREIRPYTHSSTS